MVLYLVQLMQQVLRSGVRWVIVAAPHLELESSPHSEKRSMDDRYEVRVRGISLAASMVSEWVLQAHTMVSESVLL